MGRQESWIGELLEDLAAAGATGREAAAYLRTHGIRIAVRRQPTGARWTLTRSVEISPSYVQEARPTPYALSLLVHEVQHIRQGMLTALSVYGELGAWHVQFRFLLEHGRGRWDIPGDSRAIRRLLAIPLGWDRSALREARGLMAQYAGPRYRIGILPLYPLHAEIFFRISGGRLGGRPARRD